MLSLDDETYAALSAVRIAELVRRREASARNVIAAALRRLERLDGWLRAFQEIWVEQAVRTALAVDRAAADGRWLPLAGVPLAVKAWERLDSPQVARLLSAGCVPVGATSVPLRTTSWQTWGHTERGPTANPWHPDRTPGGSSAGSAAAVAAGIVPMATGMDGAGSIRVPAAWCGIVGMKVTNGLVLTRDSAGLSAPGPLVRTVADAAAYLDVLLGPSAAVPRRTRQMRVAWTPTLGYAETTPEQAEVAYGAARRLADSGSISLCRSTVELWDPQPAWLALRGGTDTTLVEPLCRENDRRLEVLFDQADLLATPTTPVGPHRHEGPGSAMSVSLTWAFNLSGHPALSIPAGFTPDGLPVGLQLVARRGQERALIHAAAELERLASWASWRE